MTDEEGDPLFQEWEDDSLLFMENFDDDVSSSFQSCINSQDPQVSAKGEIFLQQIDEDQDYAFALALQTQYEDEVKENIISNPKESYTKDSKSSKPLSIIDEQWELIDPHPDIHALFQEYDAKYFYGKLKHVEVKWSPRMTLCAGVCSYEGRGGLCSVRLSVPLLKLRPRKDLVETLLHEMIHAYLFVTNNNKDRDGHGPEFLSHMHRINKESGTRISVYHSFHDEVELYRQHWWKCDGPCKNRRPYYGVLKRAMNRPPGPKDNWWADHQKNCGGTFVKIKEPENYGKKKTAKRKTSSVTESKGSSSDIRSLFGNGVSKNAKSGSVPSSTKLNIPHTDSSLIKQNNVATFSSVTKSPKKLIIPFQGVGHKLGGSSNARNSKPPYIKESSFSKVITSSSSSGKAVNVESLSNICKFPRLSNSQRSVFEEEKPNTSVTANNFKRNLVQSPMEKFLTSKNISNNSHSTEMKKENRISHPSVQESDVLRVFCPVCFVLVKEQDINYHLDSCLSS